MDYENVEMGNLDWQLIGGKNLFLSFLLNRISELLRKLLLNLELKVLIII